MSQVEIGVKVVVEEMDEMKKIVNQLADVAEAVEKAKAAVNMEGLKFDDSSLKELRSLIEQLQTTIQTLKQTAKEVGKIELKLNTDEKAIAKSLQGAFQEALSKMEKDLNAMFKRTGMSASADGEEGEGKKKSKSAPKEEGVSEELSGLAADLDKVQNSLKEIEKTSTAVVNSSEQAIKGYEQGVKKIEGVSGRLDAMTQSFDKASKQANEFAKSTEGAPVNMNADQVNIDAKNVRQSTKDTEQVESSVMAKLEKSGKDFGTAGQELVQSVTKVDKDLEQAAKEGRAELDNPDPVAIKEADKMSTDMRTIFAKVGEDLKGFSSDVGVALEKVTKNLNSFNKSITGSNESSGGSGGGKGGSGGGSGGGRGGSGGSSGGGDDELNLDEAASGAVKLGKSLETLSREDIPASFTALGEGLRKEMASIGAESLREYIEGIRTANKMAAEGQALEIQAKRNELKLLNMIEKAHGKAVAKDAQEYGAQEVAEASEFKGLQNFSKGIDQAKTQAAQLIEGAEAIRKGVDENIMATRMAPLEEVAQDTYRMIQATEDQVKVQKKAKDIQLEISDAMSRYGTEMTKAMQEGDPSKVQVFGEIFARTGQTVSRTSKEIIKQNRNLFAESEKLAGQVEANKSKMSVASPEEQAELAVANKEMEKRITKIGELRQVNEKTHLQLLEKNAALQDVTMQYRAYRDALKTQDAQIQKGIRDYHRLQLSIDETTKSVDRIMTQFKGAGKFEHGEAERFLQVYKDIGNEINKAENAIQSLMVRQERMKDKVQKQYASGTGEFEGLNKKESDELLGDRTQAIDDETNKKIIQLRENIKELAAERKSMHEGGAQQAAKDAIAVANIDTEFTGLVRKAELLGQKYQTVMGGANESTEAFQSSARTVKKVDSEYNTLTNSIEENISKLEVLSQQQRLDKGGEAQLANLRNLRRAVQQQRKAIGETGNQQTASGILFTDKQIQKTDADFKKLQGQMTQFTSRMEMAKHEINQGGDRTLAAAQDFKKLGSELKSARQGATQVIASYDQLERQGISLSAAQKKQRAEAVKLNQQYTGMSTSINKMRPELNQIETAAARAGKGFKLYRQELANSIVNNFRFIHAMGMIMSALMAARTGFQELIEESRVIARTMTVARSEFMNYEQMLTKVTKTTRELAIEFGETVDQVAEVIKQFGSAGLQLEESLAGARPALELITATGAEAEATARSMAGVYNVFGDQLSETGNQMEAMSKISDVMSSAYINHQMELDEMTQGLRFAASTGKVAGFTFQDLSAYLAVLNDNMIKSGAAGRTLQRVFAQFAAKPEQFAQAFGIEVDTDAQLSEQFVDILEHVNRELRTGKTTTEDLNDTFSIFGLRGARAFEVLAGNVDDVHAAMKEMNEEAGGASAAISEITKESLHRQWEAMKQALLEILRNGLEPTVKILKIFTDQVLKVQEVLAFFKLDKLATNILMWGGALMLVIQSLGATSKLIGTMIGMTKKSLGTRLNAIKAIGTEVKARMGLNKVRAQGIGLQQAENASMGRGAGAKALMAGGNPLGKAGGATGGMALLGGPVTIALAFGVAIYAALNHFTDLFRTARDVRNEIDEIRTETGKWQQEIRELSSLSNAFGDIRDDFKEMNTSSKNLATNLRETVRTANISPQFKNELMTMSDDQLVSDIDNIYDRIQVTVDRRTKKLEKLVASKAAKQGRLLAEEFDRGFRENIPDWAVESEMRRLATFQAMLNNVLHGNTVQGFQAPAWVETLLGGFDNPLLTGKIGNFLGVQPEWLGELADEIDNIAGSGESAEVAIESLEKAMLNVDEDSDVAFERMDYADTENKIAEQAIELRKVLEDSGAPEEQVNESIWQFIQDRSSGLAQVVKNFEEGTSGFINGNELIQESYRRIQRQIEQGFLADLGPERLSAVSQASGLGGELQAVADILGTPISVDIFNDIEEEVWNVRKSLDETTEQIFKLTEAIEDPDISIDATIEMGPDNINLREDAVTKTIQDVLNRNSQTVSHFIPIAIERGLIDDEAMAALANDEAGALALQEYLGDEYLLNDFDMGDVRKNVEGVTKAVDAMGNSAAFTNVLVENMVSNLRNAGQELDEGIFENMSREDLLKSRDLSDLMQGSRFNMSALGDEERESAIGLMVDLEVGDDELHERLREIPEEVPDVDLIKAFHAAELTDELGNAKFEMRGMYDLMDEFAHMAGVSGSQLAQIWSNFGIESAAMIMDTIRTDHMKRFVEQFETGLRAAREENELFQKELEETSIRQEISLMGMQDKSVQDLRDQIANFSFTTAPSSEAMDSDVIDTGKIEEEREAEHARLQSYKDALELNLDLSDIQKEQVHWIEAGHRALDEQGRRLGEIRRDLQGDVSLVLERADAMEMANEHLVADLEASRELAFVAADINEISTARRSILDRNLTGLEQIKSAYGDMLELRKELLRTIQDENQVVFESLALAEQIMQPQNEMAGVKYEILGYSRRINALELRRVRVNRTLGQDIEKRAEYESEVIKINSELLNLYQEMSGAIQNIVEEEDELLESIDKRVDLYSKLADHLGEQAEEFEDTARSMMDSLVETMGDGAIRDLADSIGASFVDIFQDTGSAVDDLFSMMERGQAPISNMNAGFQAIAESAMFFRQEQEKINDRMDELRQFDMERSLAGFNRAFEAGDLDKAEESLDSFVSAGEDLFEDSPAAMSRHLEQAINMAEDLSEMEVSEAEQEIRLVINDQDRDQFIALFDELKRRAGEISSELKDIVGLSDEALGEMVMDGVGGHGPEIMRSSDAAAKSLDSIDTTLEELNAAFHKYSGTDIEGSESYGADPVQGSGAASEAAETIEEVGDAGRKMADDLDHVQETLTGIGKLGKHLDLPDRITEANIVDPEREYSKFQVALLGALAKALSRPQAFQARGSQLRDRNPMLDSIASTFQTGAEEIGETLSSFVSQVFVPEFAKINAEVFATFLTSIDDLTKRYHESNDAAITGITRNESTYLGYVNTIMDAEKQRHDDIMAAQQEYRDSIKTTREVIEEQFGEAFETFFDGERAGAIAGGALTAITGAQPLEASMNQFIGAAGEVRAYLAKELGEGLAGLISKLDIDVPTLFKTFDNLNSEIKGKILDGLAISGLDVDDELVKNMIKMFPAESFIQDKMGGKLFETLGAGAELFKSTLVTAATSITSFIFSGIGQVVQMTIGEDADQMVRYMSKFLEELPQAISEFAEDFAENFDIMATALADNLPGIITNLVQALPEILSSVMRTMDSELPKIVDALANAIPMLVGTVVPLMLDFLILVIEQLPTIIEALAEAIPVLIASLASKILPLIFAVIKAIVLGIIGLIKGIGQGIGRVFTGNTGDNPNVYHDGGMIGEANERLSNLNRIKPDEEFILAQTGEGVLSRVGMAALGGPGMLNELNRGNQIGGIMAQYRRDQDIYHDGGMIGSGNYSSAGIDRPRPRPAASGGGDINNYIDATGGGTGNRRDDKRLAKTIAKEIDKELSRDVRDGKSKMAKELNR